MSSPMGPGYYLYFGPAESGVSHGTVAATAALGGDVVPAFMIPWNIREDEENVLAEILTTLLVADEQ